MIEKRPRVKLKLFKMATICCCKVFLVGFLLTSCTALANSEVSDESESHRRHRSSHSGTVHFNNPGLLRKATNGLKDQGVWNLDKTQERVDPKKMGGIYIPNEAKKTASKLRMIANSELAVTSMQGVFDSLHYRESKPNREAELDQLAERLQQKFDLYLKILKTSKLAVESFYHKKHLLTQRHDCCRIPDEDLRSENQYRWPVSRQTSCDLIPGNAPFYAFNPGRNLTEVFQANIKYIPSVKWQYFISTEGIHNEYPAHNFRHAKTKCRDVHDTRHRDVFVSTVEPQRKNVVIVMDHGNSLSDNQIITAKAIANHILDSLSENDRVGVIGLSADVVYPGKEKEKCVSRQMAPLTYEAKMYFKKFIKGLQKTKTATAHPLGIQKAFEMVWNTIGANVSHVKEEAMIMYISRGLLRSLTEAKEVMETIAEQNGRLRNKVLINTYAVIDDGKPIMYEKTFLQAIAAQDFKKYDVKKKHRSPILPGVMLAVNTTKDLSTTVGKFYLSLNRSTPNGPRFSLPYIDEAGQGLTISITWPCMYEGRTIGVVGLDLHAAEVMEDVTYYNQSHNSYSFVINTEGFTIMHPSLKRPSHTDMQPVHTDIWHFENYKEFHSIRSDMLNSTEGRETMTVLRNVTGYKNRVDPNEFEITQSWYLWKHLKGIPYIAVVKVSDVGRKFREPTNTPVRGAVVYHRLDLMPTETRCMHLKELATSDTCSVFLSATSFVEPFEHLSQTETKRIVQGYTAYLKDNTRLIANPGLRDEVRNDVAALSGINTEWMAQFHYSPLRDYIVRRYVAAPTGVFRVFPGTLIDKSYDPSKRDWFNRALEFPGKVTLTAPYLDVGGAGYIVTLSHTIYEGKTDAMHGPGDRVVAVMGIDFTLGYFYKLLIETLPACEQEKVRCFILDDKGYLIAHPRLIEPNGKAPLEQLHITHQEPLVANDILNHDGFVQKKLCNSYNDRTIQRFYSFNTSLDRPLTNLVHGEHCSRYQIAGIPGTNAFIGIVNQTCTYITAFCPCSIVDRLCLNCGRVEQNECECPCECPLEMDLCAADLLLEEDGNPSCPRYPETNKRAEVDDSISSNLPQCVQTKCEERKHKKDCFGVLDCEWCEKDVDGTSPLGTPFCTSQRGCFGGVLGAATPYSDEIKVYPQHQEQAIFKSTPVGPVAGGIMGCFLVLALGVYCYRHHIHRHSHQYITTVSDTQVRMSQLDNEPDDDIIQEDPGAGHTNIVLATFENPASISPYRVNTQYRRPPAGDSDHGYSTMTPHEDSEQASTTCIEPLILGKERYKPQAFVRTPMIPPPPSSRRSRSPTPPQTRLVSHHAPIPEQTVIPSHTIIPTIPESSHGPHNVIANVQVHMVDTH